MEERLIIYRSRENGGWPTDLLSKYKKYHLLKPHYGIVGPMVFQEGSTEQVEFSRELVARNLRYVSQRELRTSGSDLAKHDYYYLSVKFEREYEDVCDPELFSTETACPGDSNVLCGEGTVQVNKVRINMQKSKRYDIMWHPRAVRPRILLVSKRLRDIMLNNSLSGCHFVPCLEAGRQYQEYEHTFNPTDDYGNVDASYYQLVVTATVNNPPQVLSGNPGVQCSKCHTAFGFNTFDEPYFQTDDLKPVDFQAFEGYVINSGEYVRIHADTVIISYRILRLLIEHKMTGWDNYMDNPVIKYRVVDIHNA